ncbi:MAG: selenium cofactor biosynthesis protein YqeC [Syntrophothermus sp.]
MKFFNALEALGPEQFGAASGQDVCRVISFTGAGGKTTALYVLAAELAAVAGPVVLTTTTAMFAPRASEVDRLVLADEYPVLEGRILQALQEILAGGVVQAQAARRALRIMVAAGLHDGGKDRPKLRGIPPDWIDRLSQALFHHVKYILVEADGARGRPLKAPGPHEPVIPASTGLVIPVLGRDAWDKPLTEAYVHRPELVAQLTGLSRGERVTAQALVDLFLHPNGLCKGVPPGAAVVPLINKVEDEAGLAAARELARAVLFGRENIQETNIQGFLLGHVGLPDPVIEWVTIR